MRRSIPVLASAIVVLSLTAIGCVDSEKPKAQQTTVANVGPWRPPEGPGKALVAPVPWRALGRDQTNAHWEGYLTVEEAPEGYLRTGHFEWAVKVGGGRYHFDGTYDPATRVVRWVGFHVEDQVGLPGMATYQATLSADGRRLENGTWFGPQCIPGTWSAERMEGW
jgi:hypothetical protein